MRIAVIEDNETLANAISYRLRDRGHAVNVLSDGLEGEEFLRQEAADLVVLDINLPGKNGLEILSGLRQQGNGVPVILLTARGDIRDRVDGLDTGADDYLTKPFEMDELEARIRALLRRKNLDYSPREKVGQLEFDRSTRQILQNGRSINVPRREMATLECLLDRRGRIVSKNQLIDHVYGVGADVDNTAIEPHVLRLRQRVKEYGLTIKVARGLGYMLEAK